jgi:perosamine synthetase
MYRIPLSAPLLMGREREYINQALDQNQLSGGEFVTRFEEAFAQYVGAKHAIATSNGTTAVHLALRGAGIQKNDEVTVPTLTYIAAPNAITYCGATPVFLDSDLQTWQAPATGDLWQAHLTVHTYGVAAPVPTDRTAVEDCAEALGTRVDGRHVGTFGVTGAFSFYGNKVITCGEGGMVVTNYPDVAEKVRLLRSQGQDPTRRYHHPVIGFNYRMTNLQAAIGLGQLETIEEHLERRRKVQRLYQSQLEGYMRWPEGEDISPWLMVGAFVDQGTCTRVEQACEAASIETRPVFLPCHRQTPYRDWKCVAPVADLLYQTGLVLPLHAGLSLDNVIEICAVVREATR